MKKLSVLLIALFVMAIPFVSGCDSDDDGVCLTDGDGDTAKVSMPYIVVKGGVAIEEGTTLTLTAQTVNGEDTSYEWGSSDKTVATVDESGVVTGVSPGEASITATGSDTGETGSWGVYVYVIEETESAVTVSGAVALEVGRTTTLTATTKGQEDSGYDWTSSDDSLATVDENGLVLGVGPGEVVITATGKDSGESGSWGMYICVPAVEVPVVTVTGGISVIVGETLTLTASTTDDDDSGYDWASGDEAVATVADGVVTGVAPGEVIITATGQDTNISGSLGIVVLPMEEDKPPFYDIWAASAHADSASEAFVHWDEDGSIPANCAKCHSESGYLDYLGVDGSAAGSIEVDAPIGTVVSCLTCHNTGTIGKTSVMFPSGVTLEGLGSESRCMECHQGRESSVSVNAAIAEAAATDADTPDEDLGFKNIHYYAAAATLYGNLVMGGYEYEDKGYDAKFAHVDGLATCVTCHDPHSLEVKSESCAECHAATDYKDIRMAGSLMDYDGDGNASEGIYYEVEGLQEKLYEVMQAYAAEVAGSYLIYDAGSYPYFFIDTNENGLVDDGEASFSNSYASWTERLVKGAYNYQVSLKDPGAFAHNAKYMIELLFDSIEDLNSALATPVATSATRVDSGHFEGTSEAWRHWDGDPGVEADCAKCHSADGMPFYIEHGVNIEQPQSYGMSCATCHDDLSNLSSQYVVGEVDFPSGLMVDSGDNSSNICMTCHQGRESKMSVDAYIAEKTPDDDKSLGTDDTVNAELGFRNVHYFATGATRYGTQVKGGYEYDGMAYDGFFGHVSSADQCTDCHNAHKQSLKFGGCIGCHEGLTTEEDLKDIRMASSTIDYDGDGVSDEGIYYEVEGLKDKLYEVVQAYAAEIAGTYLIYEGHTYPYFFVDTNENNQVDPGEAIYPNSYKSWTPRLLKAAYNMQFVIKDPGAYAHNAKYVIQLMNDSIMDLNDILSTPVEFMGSRNDQGHFDGISEAWRHWDNEDVVEVPASCARCHSTEGIDYYIANGSDTTNATPVSWGLSCENCHSGFSADSKYNAPIKYVANVVFPGGATLDNDAGDPDSSFLCMTCHQGREGKATVDAAIADSDFGFKNVHYLPAGAVLNGSDAEVGYEYDGKTYEAAFTHGFASSECTYCHSLEADVHHFGAKLESSCVGCHDEATVGDVSTIRKARADDYDGDGSATEALADEIATLNDALYLAMQVYATNTLSSPIIYESHSYPYFFKDTNGNGLVDPGEAIFPNSYAAWDATLMKAAFNFQLANKEPGAWAHNTKYAVQLLIDSIDDLGGNISSYTRP